MAAPAGLRTEVYADPSALPADLLDGWRELAVGAGLPYATPEWMLAFWRHRHAATAELRVVAVRDGDRLVGLGPFYAGRGPLGVSDHYLLAAGMGQRTAPLAAPGAEREVAAALARALAGGRPRPSALMLDAFDAASPWPALLADAWPGRPRPRLVVDRREAGLGTRTAEDYDAWLGRRSARFRERLRRSHRKVAGRGGVVRRSETPAQLRADLEALFRLHALRFASLDRRSSLVEPAYRAAAAEAAEALLPHGGTRLWVIEAEGEVVAANLAFRAGGRMCGWTTGMDPAWREQSPGFVLLTEVVRDAHELGVDLVDFSAGTDEYKARLADLAVPLTWSALLVRDGRYPVVLARRAPRRARRTARALARRLPPDARERLRRLSGRR